MSPRGLMLPVGRAPPDRRQTRLKHGRMLLMSALLATTGLTAMATPATADSPPQCSDGIDNDGDGRTDYPSDEGCSSELDDDERPQSGGGSVFPHLELEDCALRLIG